MQLAMKLLGEVLVFLLWMLTIARSEDIPHPHNPLNQTKFEVTTIKIAEIINLKNNSTNTTIVLKEKTAKHFLTTTTNTRVLLIPPAMINAQIVRKKTVHKS
jgi:hypothetical protein